MPASATYYAKQIGGLLRVNRVQGVGSSGLIISSGDGVETITLSGSIVSETASINSRLTDDTSSGIQGLASYANDSAAASGGVSVGYWYVNSSSGAITQRLV